MTHTTDVPGGNLAPDDKPESKVGNLKSNRTFVVAPVDPASPSSDPIQAGDLASVFKASPGRISLKVATLARGEDGTLEEGSAEVGMRYGVENPEEGMKDFEITNLIGSVSTEPEERRAGLDARPLLTQRLHINALEEWIELLRDDTRLQQLLNDPEKRREVLAALEGELARMPEIRQRLEAQGK